MAIDNPMSSFFSLGSLFACVIFSSVLLLVDLILFLDVYGALNEEVQEI